MVYTTAETLLLPRADDMDRATFGFSFPGGRVPTKFAFKTRLFSITPSIS